MKMTLMTRTTPNSMKCVRQRQASEPKDNTKLREDLSPMTKSLMMMKTEMTTAILAMIKMMTMTTPVITTSDDLILY